jgi:hypothetical protein
VAPTAYRVFFHDEAAGPSWLDLLYDVQAMAAQLEGVEAGAAAAYLRFLAHAKVGTKLSGRAGGMYRSVGNACGRCSVGKTQIAAFILASRHSSDQSPHACRLRLTWAPRTSYSRTSGGERRPSHSDQRISHPCFQARLAWGPTIIGTHYAGLPSSFFTPCFFEA